MEASTKANDAWSLRFKVEVFIWCRVVNVPKSSTTFRGILIWAICRPVICENVLLCPVLHWRIISIKRFFSGVHACVNVSMHEQTLHKRHSDIYSVCKSIGTVYTCINSWKEALNAIVFTFYAENSHMTSRFCMTCMWQKFRSINVRFWN